MSANQIVFPFLLKKAEAGRKPNIDLIGRWYKEDHALITIIGLCPGDDGRVMVERDIDGHTWSMPAWLMRLVFMEKKKRKRAA